MRIVICAKEVLDPDAVNNYALEGKLEIGDDGKSLTQAAIPRLMNAYDEQALEAALKLRDDGVDCTIAVVCAGEEPTDILKHAAAMGADEIVHIPLDTGAVDYHVSGFVLAKWIESSGGADLVLCGRQASDDDQGVVPALIGERLGAPVVTIARAVGVSDGTVRVTRVTPEGDEVVEASMPAVVTVSNEVGEPRYPTMQMKMKARRRSPDVAEVASLGIDDADLRPRVTMTKQFVPTVEGDCEFLEAGSAAELADALVAKLREASII